MKLCCVATKIGTRICLYTPYKYTKFKLDQSTHLRVKADFVICAKRRRKKTETLVSRILETPGTIYLNFGIWLTLIGGHFYSKFSDLQVKFHGSMSA